MANASFTKGSPIEVSSDEPGFHGAWYTATFVDVSPVPPSIKSASNKKNRNTKKIWYTVKYDTLVKNDKSSELLTEVVDSSFVRPLPPRNVRRNNDGNATEAEGEDCGEFEVYDVVDAYHRDGWWMGVVKHVIIEREMKKYVVQFENPTEEFEFERSKLRFHVDWIDCRWLVPPKKRPKQELGDRNATYTSDDAHSGLSTQADVDNGTPHSAKKLSGSRKRSESNSAPITYTYSRKKRSVNLVADDETRGKRFQSSTGSKGNTKVIASVLETNGSDVLHQESPPTGHKIINTQTRKSGSGKRGRPPKLVVKRPTGLLEGSKGNTKVTASVLETSGSDVLHQESPPAGHRIITTQTRKSGNRKRGRPPKLVVKRPAGLLEGSKGNTNVTASVLETSRSDILHQESPPTGHKIIIKQTRKSGNGKRGRPPKLVVKRPTGLLEGGHEVSTASDEQPLPVWYNGMHPHSDLKRRSSCFSPPDNYDNPLGAGTGTTTDCQQDWPFTMRSPVWSTIGLHLTPPQKPHFSPLKKMKEDYREGYAIAHMVTYANLVQMLSCLQLNDRVDILNESLETLRELETHGFDVGSIRGRLNGLLSLKSKLCHDEDKVREVEKELEECNHEKCLMEKEVDELKVKMQELQEKMARVVAMQKAKEEQVTRLESNLLIASKQVNESELAFGKLVATPL